MSAADGINLVGTAPAPRERRYLGDAVYVEFDGWQFTLRTGDGNHQVIHLEPAVLAGLIEYGKDMGVLKR